MSDVVTPEVVFEWRAPISDEMVRKERLTFVATFGVGLAMITWGVLGATGVIAGDARFLVVVGMLLAGLGQLGYSDSRRLRSTIVRVDRMGTLRVTDGKAIDSIDLRTVSALSIRRRTGRSQWRWSIEAVHHSGAWHTEFAPLAHYWNLDEADVAALEVELQRWLSWATGRVAATPQPQSSAGKPTSAAANASAAGMVGPIPVRGAVISTADAFEWRPAAQPNKARNRRRLRIGFVGFALTIAVIAAVSEAENGIAAVLFSMFVPVLILVIGFAIDRVYDLGGRFRIGVDHQGLWIRRSSAEPLVVPRDEVRTLTLTLTSNPTFDADVDSTSWNLSVVHANGDPVNVRLPLHLGTSFARDDAIALEAELRRRLGV